MTAVLALQARVAVQVADPLVPAYQVVSSPRLSFSVCYFMDTAFWVPKFDKEFYDDKETIGHFAR